MSGASVISDMSASVGPPRCLTLDEIKLRHEFKQTNDMELNNKTGKSRRMRRHCQAAGCNARMSMECTNPVCKKKDGFNNCKGVYFCPLHFNTHWETFLD